MAAGRWTLLYDADCGFCQWIASGVLAWDREGLIVPRAIQSESGRALLSDLTTEQALASVHVVAPGGERFSGGAAAAPLIAVLPGGGSPARAIRRIPRLTGRAYDLVAGHRSLLSKAVPERAKRRARAAVARAETERSTP